MLNDSTIPNIKRASIAFWGPDKHAKQQFAVDTDNLSLAIILKAISYRDQLRSSFESTKIRYIV